MKWNERYLPGLGTSAPVRALVSQKTEEAANIVRATAPVDSGEYVANVRTEIIATPYRVVGKVIVDVPHAMLVEGRHGTLRRALRRVMG